MELSTRQVADLVEVFRLLGEPNRLRLVLSCLEAPRTVGDLVDKLGLSQTLVSHHLRLLRGAHVLRGDRQGRQVHYAIDDEHVRDTVRNMIAHLTEPHEHRLSAEPSENRQNPRRTTMATETQKCACKDCVCKVSADQAITKDGQMFCCEECAAGHKGHAGCEHDGCNCRG